MSHSGFVMLSAVHLKKKRFEPFHAKILIGSHWAFDLLDNIDISTANQILAHSLTLRRLYRSGPVQAWYSDLFACQGSFSAERAT